MDVVPTTRGHWRTFFINLGLAAAARELGFEVVGHAESPSQGPAGNREWLLRHRLGGAGRSAVAGGIDLR